MAEIFVTPNQIAIELKCSLRVARRYIVGEMPHLRVGKLLRVSFPDYNRWKASKRRTTDAFADGSDTPLDPRLVGEIAAQMRSGKIKYPGVRPADARHTPDCDREYAKALARKIRRDAADRACATATGGGR